MAKKKKEELQEVKNEAVKEIKSKKKKPEVETFEENGKVYKAPRILENKEKAKKEKKSKKSEKKEVERLNPSPKTGLSEAEVEKRTLDGYNNIVENKRINGKVVQTVKANLGPVTEEQIPYLKAAYAKKKPRLVYDD